MPPFPPREFHNLALWLIEQRNDEASLRTAISRVYYACHLLAKRSLMEKRKWMPSGRGDDHSGVIRELRRGKTTGLGNYLDSLRTLREHADYHVDPTVTGAENCSVCKKIGESSPPPPQNVIIEHWNNAKSISERCLSLIDKL
jgi:hypothetical protein